MQAKQLGQFTLQAKSATLTAIFFGGEELPPLLAVRGEFPKMQDLKMEYASTLTEKKKLYQALNELNPSPPRQADDAVGFAKQSELTIENKELLVAKENIDKLLKTESELEQEQEKNQKIRKKKTVER